MNKPVAASEVGDLFARHRAPFIIVRDCQFHIGTESYHQLTVFIHEIRPVRKFFEKRTLKCYSLNCRTGKRGQLCELCVDRHRCSRRLQLRLAYAKDRSTRPAILEVPEHSFHAVDDLLREAGTTDDILHVPIGIKVIESAAGRPSLDFEMLF